VTQDFLQQAGVEVEDESKSLAESMEEAVMSRMMAMTCGTYKYCCENTALLDLREANGAPRQCKVIHAGMEADVTHILADPSHPEHCHILSGSDSILRAPSMFCDIIDGTEGFSLDQCQEDYCAKGLQGFEDFISVLVVVWREWMRTVGCLMAMFAIMQIVQLTNMYYIQHQIGRVADDEDDDDDDDDFVAGLGPVEAWRTSRVTTTTTRNTRITTRKTNRDGPDGVVPNRVSRMSTKHGRGVSSTVVQVQPSVRGQQSVRPSEARTTRVATDAAGSGVVPKKSTRHGQEVAPASTVVQVQPSVRGQQSVRPGYGR